MEKLLKMNMQDKIYNCAVIGCGRIASSFEFRKDLGHPCSHLGVYHFLPNTMVIAICDNNPDTLKSVGDEWNIPKRYLDYKEMLDNNQIDILSICTPPDVRKDICKYACSKGVKAIFSEKPLASNSKDGREIVDICKTHGVKLIVNHSRRWYKTFRAAKEIIESRTLGHVIHINAYSYAGLLNIGTHILDTMIFLNGDIIEIYGMLTPNSKSKDDKGISATIKFKNGSSGGIYLLDGMQYDLTEFEVICTDGIMKIMNNGKKLDVYSAHNNHLKKTRIVESFYPFREAFISSVKEIISCIEKNVESISSGEDGLKSLDIITSCYENYRNNTS